MNGLMEVLERDNPWWKTGSILKEHKDKRKRIHCYKLLLACYEWFERHKVYLIEGPRQVGKTHILYHLVDELISEGCPPQSICYVNVQDPDIQLYLQEASLERLLHECLNRPAASRLAKQHPFLPLLLLDEIQYADKWGDWLKKFADDPRFTARIVGTGSALRLVRGIRESGVGRWKTMRVPHITFYEYIRTILPPTEKTLIIPELKYEWSWDKPSEQTFAEIQKEIDYEKLKPLFDEFLAKGGYPDPAGKSVTAAQESIRQDIISRVLQDPVDLKVVRGKLELQKLFYYLATHTAEILSKDKISKESGLNRQTLNDYLQCLEDINLIFDAPLFRNDGSQALKSHDKVHVATPCVVSALRPADAEKSLRGHILESAAAAHLYDAIQGRNGFLSYWREKADGPEVDIVVHWPEGVVPLEVKSRGRQSGMAAFQTKFAKDIQCAFLLKDANEWNAKWEKHHSQLTMPLPHFLYMMGFKEQESTEKEIQMKRQAFLESGTIEIRLPESLTDLNEFRKKQRSLFQEMIGIEPFFRLAAGPGRLRQSLWNLTRSEKELAPLLRYPPRIREGIVGDWYPGVENHAEIVSFDEGIKGELFVGGYRYKSIFLYYNGALEFFVPVDDAFLLHKRKEPWINPFPLVEYTVNFFRLFKRIVEVLSLEGPYWFELQIQNSQGFELHPGHPESMAHLRPEIHPGARIHQEDFGFDGTIPRFNPFKDVEAFEILKTLYYKLGLRPDDLPFFEPDGTCRIQ